MSDNTLLQLILDLQQRVRALERGEAVDRTVVVSTADATTTPTASKIPRADGAGKLDPAWLSGINVGAGNTAAVTGHQTISGNLALGGAAPLTSENRIRQQGAFPGIELHDATNGTKTLAIQINGDVVEFRRNAANFGALEAIPTRFSNLAPAASVVLRQDGALVLGRTTTTLAAGTEAGSLDANNRVAATVRFRCAGLDGVDGTYTIVTGVRNNAGTIQYKTRSMTLTGGIVTTVGAESAWTNA